MDIKVGILTPGHYHFLAVVPITESLEECSDAAFALANSECQRLFHKEGRADTVPLLVFPNEQLVRAVSHMRSQPLLSPTHNQGGIREL